MKERAYAKINLCLDVIGRTEDGYHQLKMIMVPLDFYDVLEMVPGKETSLRTNRGYIPVNDRNTVIKAIHVMQERYGIRTQYDCRLVKHIPTQAGLGGGSADAAAAIRMIDRMEGLHLSTEEMLEAGKQVGSDVPFCILNHPALVEGTGEKITTFDIRCRFDILLVKPRRGVSTAAAFQAVDEEEPVHPDCREMQRALMEDDYPAVVRALGNSLEGASLKLVKEIRTVKEKLTDCGFDGVLMSGSGSTVFGITRDRTCLESALETLRTQGYFVRSTHILNEGL